MKKKRGPPKKGKYKTCEECGELYYSKLSQLKSRRFCSRVCRAKDAIRTRFSISTSKQKKCTHCEKYKDKHEFSYYNDKCVCADCYTLLRKSQALREFAEEVFIKIRDCITSLYYKMNEHDFITNEDSFKVLIIALSRVLFFTIKQHVHNNVDLCREILLDIVEKIYKQEKEEERD